MSEAHVLLLITGLDHGGAERQAVSLAMLLKARGWDVDVVTMLRPRAYVPELESLGIQVQDLGMRQGIPDPRAIVRLARLLRKIQPQVVHSHMVHANILARVTRLLVHVPVLICTAHSINEGGRRRELAYRLTDSLCDITTQVSQAGLERYVRVKAVPRHKIMFVPNGVDTGRFRPDESTRAKTRSAMGTDNAFVWLAVGRFAKAKDYPTMTRAFAKVVAQRKDAVLLIAGQGALRDEVEGIARDLGISSYVKFLGVRKDVPALMASADAYVMSSAWEGMPMVLLEASAVGLPIVATDVGGNADIVRHGNNGFLVPPRDPDALAAAMVRLMDTPIEVRKRMGEFGRQHIEAHYSLERVVERWEVLYSRLLRVRCEST